MNTEQMLKDILEAAGLPPDDIEFIAWPQNAEEYQALCDQWNVIKRGPVAFTADGKEIYEAEVTYPVADMTPFDRVSVQQLTSPFHERDFSQ